MEKKATVKFLNYLILVTILATGLLFLLHFQGYPDKQFLIGVLTSFLYFLWGIGNHLVEDDLHIKIVIEYFLIALLSIFLLRGVLRI